MPKIDNEKFYESAIQRYGTTAKGLNWHSKENQNIRFKTILDLLPKNLDSLSIGDAGCGFGDFYIYMQKRKRFPKEYVGIDSLLDMYSIASAKTGCEIIMADICKDKLPIMSYYICSGAMNILNEFETYLFIQNCYKSSEIGFVFNLLYGDKESKTYNYITKDKIYEIAKGLDVKEIVFKDGYLEDDITVGFFK